jgi:hypothetical protein
VRAAADLQIEEAEADIALQVRSAYFQLVLADQMVGIAREAFELADATLRQVELFRQQGTAAEFDVLRAQVERDNLEPAIVEAQNARRVAELNLKRLINLPAEQPIATATPLDAVIADVDRDRAGGGARRACRRCGRSTSRSRLARARSVSRGRTGFRTSALRAISHIRRFRRRSRPSMRLAS